MRVSGAFFLTVFGLLHLHAQTTVWRGAAGQWNDASLWSAGRPTGFLTAVVRGNGLVTVPPGTYVTGDLQIGVYSGDHSRVEVDGGQLVLMQDSLHVGEESGGEGEFILHDGAMHCVMDVFVGGASEVPGAANKATLRIQGGSFLGRTITVGIGIGSEAVVSLKIRIASSIPIASTRNLRNSAGMLSAWLKSKPGRGPCSWLFTRIKEVIHEQTTVRIISTRAF